MSITTPAVLVTIPLSHYCEKARWGLDRVRFAYREKPQTPLLHRWVTMRNAGSSVPLLIDGAQRFGDSTAILQHADSVSGGGQLYPSDTSLRLAVESIVARFDTELGIHTRRWAYAYLLPDTALLRRLWSSKVSSFEAKLVPLLLPTVRRLVRKAYRITPDSAERSLRRVLAIFHDIDERLGDKRQFLIGNRFTAADLTFAALAAPMLLPPECRGTLPALAEVPKLMRDDIRRLRATPAGQFALRLYKEERG